VIICDGDVPVLFVFIAAMYVRHSSVVGGLLRTTQEYDHGEFGGDGVKQTLGVGPGKRLEPIDLSRCLAQSNLNSNDCYIVKFASRQISLHQDHDGRLVFASLKISHETRDAIVSKYILSIFKLHESSSYFAKRILTRVSGELSWTPWCATIQWCLLMLESTLSGQLLAHDGEHQEQDLGPRE
jgi:hypothetical protein